jgi:hypothetical protein
MSQACTLQHIAFFHWSKGKKRAICIVAQDLWLKVTLSFPGDMDVTGDVRNPEAGRRATNRI